MFFRVRFDRTELIKIIQMHQIHHVKSFKCNKTEFDSIEPNRTRKNIEILKKFGSREAMFNSIRFGSVSEKSSRVSLYYTRYLP